MENPAPSIAFDRTPEAISSRVRTWRKNGERIGFVPTMGALHAGHLALVEAAKAKTDRTVVSIFVNPKQFAPTEDFAAYPRGEAEDAAALENIGVDAIFAPSAEAIYPPGFATAIQVGGPAAGLETDFRPLFFDGVATVVSKLLNIVRPDTSFFGEKDYQQLLVIRRIALDLSLPGTVEGLATVREDDGLALSSRNAYLTAHERKTAPKLHAALQNAASDIRAGAPIDSVTAAAIRNLAAAGFKVDYLELRNAEDLQPVAEYTPKSLRLLVAAWLGRTRLIDNIPV